MTSQRWVLAVAAVAAVVLGAAGCSDPKPTPRTTLPPPVFPSVTVPPVPPVAAGCTSSLPLGVPVNRGWERTYTICANGAGTAAVINNISTGVLHIVPGTGSPQLRTCLTNPPDLVQTVVGQLVPAGTDLYGGVLVPPGGCALLSARGPSGVRINMDYTRTGTIFLASSFTRYALDKVGYNRTLNLVDGVKECASSASGLWRATGANPPPVSTVLGDAVGGYFSCRGVLDTVHRAIGAAPEARAETTGLLAAAEEVGSSLWEDLLRLAIDDPHLLSVLPK